MRLYSIPIFTSSGILFSLLALAALSVAQSPAHDPTAQDITTAEAQPAAPMTPEQVALIERYLTAVRAQPVGKIDTHAAAAGQGITLQTTQDATLANGTELPRGTRLTGRVLRARAYQPEGPAALLSIVIDHAVLKDGNSIPVRCVIRAVFSTAAPAATMADASQSGSRPRRGNSGAPTAGGPLSGITPMGGVPMGDPSAGDIGNSTPGGNPNSTNPNSTSTRGTIGGGASTGDPGIGGSTRPTLANASAVAMADPEQPVTSAGESIHDVPRRTGLPGVMLFGASVAGISGNLSAYEHNITLDSATQLTLGIISAK